MAPLFIAALIAAVSSATPSPTAPKSLTLMMSANLSGKLRAVVDPVAVIGAITLDVACVIGIIFIC
jgi:hypothetical protein